MCCAKPVRRRRQCPTPFFFVLLYFAFLRRVAPSPRPLDTFRYRPYLAIGVRSRFTAFATRHGRARAYCRTSFPNASGTLLASVVYTPSRVSLVAVFSARRKVPTLSRGSQFSHRSTPPHTLKSRDRHVRARRTRRLVHTLSFARTIIIVLLFTYDRRFISIYVLLSIIIIFALLLLTTDRFVVAAAHQHADCYCVRYVTTLYTVNSFVLPELFVVAWIQSTSLPFSLKSLRRRKPNARWLAWLGRLPQALLRRVRSGSKCTAASRA